MRLIASVAAPLLLLGLPTTPAPADQPDLRRIISKVDRTTKAVKTVSYRAEAWVEGVPSDEQVRYRATVCARVGARDSIGLLRIEGVVYTGASEDGSSFRLVTDGEQVVTIDSKDKRCAVGTLPEAFELMSEPWRALFMREFVHETPFSDELEADSRRYEGEKTIAGAACHVIYVVYSGGRGEARWYFGTEDYLPHRVDRVETTASGTRLRVLELSDINITPEFDEKTFAIEVPTGYELKRSGGLWPPGSMAPDWTLETPSGELVSLSKLRGKVALLVFWATWCPSCELAMSEVQKLHQRFKNKPVAVFGISTWESGEPAACARERGYTWGLLLSGDQVAEAYGVSGIPTFYVIGPEGRVAYAWAGHDPGGEEALSRQIDKILSQGD